MTGRYLLPLAAFCLACALSIGAGRAGAQAPSKELFLIQPFDGPRLTITSLDVGTDGDIVLAGILPDGPHLDAGVRIARFDAAGRRLWERNPAARSEFLSTIVARATGTDTLVLHDETPQEAPQLALLRLNARGDTVWRRELGPGAASDLLVEGGGSAVISGSVQRAETRGIEALVLRVTPEGLPVWRRRYGGETASGSNSADLLRAGGAGQTLVGALSDIAHEDEETVISSRGLVMQLQEDGHPAWRAFYGDGSTLSMIGGLARQGTGATYVLGVTDTTATLTGQFFELVRLQNDGSTAWRRPLAGPPGQEINDMVALPDGGLALAGSEPQGDDAPAAVLILLDGEGIERARVNYRGYKMRRAVTLRSHPRGGFVVLFDGPAGSGYDTTAWLARVDGAGRF